MDSLSDRGFHATAAHLLLTDGMHSPPASEHVTLMCRLRTDLRKQVLGNGILHVLRSACRWKDCPLKYEPATTTHDPYNRWSAQGL